MAQTEKTNTTTFSYRSDKQKQMHKFFEGTFERVQRKRDNTNQDEEPKFIFEENENLKNRFNNFDNFKIVCCMWLYGTFFKYSKTELAFVYDLRNKYRKDNDTLAFFLDAMATSPKDPEPKKKEEEKPVKKSNSIDELESKTEGKEDVEDEEEIVDTPKAEKKAINVDEI